MGDLLVTKPPVLLIYYPFLLCVCPAKVNIFKNNYFYEFNIHLNGLVNSKKTNTRKIKM